MANHRNNVGRLQRVLKEQGSTFRAFVTAKQATLWSIAYFAIAAFLFVAAAQIRFSLPQDPLEDGDPGYLWPALMKLSGGTFVHIQGLNFLYPGMIYLILRVFADFRAISVIQHILGLAAGALFLASWSRLGDFFPKPRLNRVAHEAIGLWGAAIYLLSNAPVLFEMLIRSDAVCMFFEAFVFWLIVQFFYYQVISPNARRAVIYGVPVVVNSFVLASLKPSFALMAFFAGGFVTWLVVTAKGSVGRKVAFFGTIIPIIVALTLTEHHLRRNDQTVKLFLPETLFVIHAKIIHAQMAADLKDARASIYSRDWLRVACDDLEAEIQRSHNLYPQKFPLLGFYPEYLRSGNADSLLDRWRHELGDEQFLGFLNYWYWHSMVRRPLAFVEKVVGQLGVFYSMDCPAFSPYRNLPLASWAYALSFAKLSQPESLHLLAMVPVGQEFLARTKKLLSTNIVIHENTLVRMWNIWCARSYLTILLLSAALAGWSLFRRNGSEPLKLPAFLVILFYSANFGNIFGISVVHTMEVWRYSAVQFIAALFAQLWAIRWLMEIALMKVQKIKSRNVEIPGKSELENCHK
jgi:hypothetical protein